MGIGTLAVDYNYNQNIQYGIKGVSVHSEESFGDEITGKATKGGVFVSEELSNS